jgi:4-oxalocrotonate tautomerase
MPHVVVKLAPGSSEERKTELAQEIVKDVMRILGRKEEVISVALEEVDPKDWTEKVYVPDIQGKWDKLYKRPGYNPFEE